MACYVAYGCVHRTRMHCVAYGCVNRTRMLCYATWRTGVFIVPASHAAWCTGALIAPACCAAWRTGVLIVPACHATWRTGVFVVPAHGTAWRTGVLIVPACYTTWRTVLALFDSFCGRQGSHEQPGRCTMFLRCATFLPRCRGHAVHCAGGVCQVCQVRHLSCALHLKRVLVATCSSTCLHWCSMRVTRTAVWHWCSMRVP